MTIKSDVERDIWDWIVNYIEVDNKFYDYKFPVCPYARSARLSGIVTVVAWEQHSVKQFIQQQVRAIVSDPDHDICVLVMPPRKKWIWGIKNLIAKLNAEVIPSGYFVQYGTAVKTKSRYPGWFNQGRYFVVFVNKLEPVLQGHQQLIRTDYYKPWSKKHYEDVVVRRQKLYETYLKSPLGVAKNQEK